MRFAQIQYIFGFWIIAATAVFFAWAFINKKKAMRRFAEEGLLEEIIDSADHRKQVVKSVIVLFAMIFCVLALMRPQWGFQWQEVKRRGLDILIAIDTSKSMLANDVKPDRLERSKLAVKDLIKKLRGDKIGLIAFSGTAFLQCPLTIDYEGFILALDDLSVNTIPRGGTSISSAIRNAFNSYEGGMSKYNILVIITDGEDNEGDPIKAAQEAKERGVKIFCVGIGTTEGELIQLTDESGGKSFLKDSEGNVVKTRLNEEVLQRIALITGGSYVRSSGAEFGLDLIYENTLSKMEKQEIKSKMNKIYYERFQMPLMIAFLLLLLEPFIRDTKRAA